MRDIAVDVDLPQITFQIIDLIQRDLTGGTVVVHLQRFSGVGHAGKNILQTAGQLGGNIPLEQIAVGIDRVALWGKFQISRNVHQHDIRGKLPQPAPQRDAIGGFQVHIQKRQLVAFQLRGSQQLLAAGADGALHLNLPGAEPFRDILVHPRSEGCIVVTDQNVHGSFPPFECKKAYSGVPRREKHPICFYITLVPPVRQSKTGQTPGSLMQGIYRRGQMQR